MPKNPLLGATARKSLHIELDVLARIREDIRSSGSGESLTAWIRRAIANELARRDERRN